ncbi:MAG: tRNA lysidine(34) synthetase TilS, partial [Saprospiraceae bacterium]
ELFVQKLAHQYGVPFFAKRFDTTVYAEHNGLSIQMAARELRYQWFQEILADHGFGQLATAHHANDALETVLLNFARGTGLAGLTGIPLRNGPVIRPLLFANRRDLATYATENGLAWREDRSNATDDYARNFVRHNLVPLFQTLNPNFLTTAGRNLRRLRATQANADYLLRRFLELPDQPNQGFPIDKQKLAQLPDTRQALQAALGPYGFTDEQARQLAENSDHIGLVIYSPGWQALNDRHQLIVTPAGQATAPSPVSIQENDLLVRLPDNRALLLTPSENAPPYPDGRSAILVDAGKLQFPLLLRPWQPGDWFQPFGMQGQRQKLQDYFTNVKLSRLEKERIWVLENGDGAIIWLLGHRLDERFKLREETVQVLKISF